MCPHIHIPPPVSVFGLYLVCIWLEARYILFFLYFCCPALYFPSRVRGSVAPLPIADRADEARTLSTRDIFSPTRNSLPPFPPPLHSNPKIIPLDRAGLSVHGRFNTSHLIPNGAA